MSKDEKKSSPSPAGHGAMPTFDPAHLLGLHSLAAGGGLPFSHLSPLSNPLSSPYGLLGQSAAAFPGLFGGLGGLGAGLPNPLHAAALQHSLAAASYYGLNKLPGDIGSSPPPSSPRPASSATPTSSSSQKGGRSSRSSSSKRASSPSPSSSHRHANSRSSSSPSVGVPQSVSPPPALPPAYQHLLPGWPPVNGAGPSLGLGGAAGFPFAYPAALTSDPRHAPSSGTSSSRRSRKSGGGGSGSHTHNSSGGSDSRTSGSHSSERTERDRSSSSNSSRKSPPAAHQHSSSSSSSSAYLSVPSAHHHHHQTSSSSSSQSKSATSSSSSRRTAPKSSPSPSTEHNQSQLQQQQQQHQQAAEAAAAAAAAAAYGGLDPRGLISPYQMSPELLYLSQSLFLQQQHHHHQQQLHSPFLAAAAAAAAAVPSSLSSSSSSSSGKKSAAVTTATSATSTRVSTSSSSSLSNTMNLSLEPGQISRSYGRERTREERQYRRREDTSPEHSSSHGRQTSKSAASEASGSVNGTSSSNSGRRSRQDDVDDRLLVDLSAASHFMDDSKRKKIAESIRRRVGGEGGSGGEERGREEEDARNEDLLPAERHGHNSVAALLSRHGIQHSDWIAHQMAAESAARADRPSPSPAHDHSGGGGGGGSDRRRRVRDNQSPQSRKSRESEISDKIRLEAELERQEEQLRELRKRYASPSGLQQESTSETSLDLSAGQSSLPHDLESVTSQRSRSRLDTTSSLSDDQAMDTDGHNLSGSDSGPSSPDTARRGGESGTEDGSPKKKAQQIDERELTIPLEHGWNRQTIISGMGRRGIVGEVLYFAPCGKKLKTIPDVMRYLERNPNSDLGRENFSFNTKANVGHFFEVRNGQGSTPVPLTDTEILEKIEMSRGKRARMQMLARRKREKAQREHALARQVMETKLKRRMELQEMSRRAAELRFQKRVEKQQMKELEKKERENKVIEKRKEKEQVRMEKQQEKLRLQESLRRERESRAQQIIEARNRRQRELEEMRIAEAMQKNKEREMKRQQLIIMKEQERERRRQQLLVIKVLEQRKKIEEKQSKERAREEKLYEKLKQREMRINHRKVELEVAAELKKPVDDMELKVAKPLPKFPRMKTRMAGRPVADTLMVAEFLKNFGPALNLDKSSIPTFESLERGLLNDNDDDVEEMSSLFMHLLRVALDDVGVPNPKEATTKLNQKVTEMEMTDSTMSEILRIFVLARGEKQMSEWLQDKPLEALSPTCKAAILAFLCNELLTSKSVTNEIDKHMDSINNLRRDKWIVEGQLRQLRVFQARKFNKIHRSSDRRLTSIANAANNSGNDSATLNTSGSGTNLSSLGDEDTMSSSKLGSDDDDDKDEDEDKEDGEEGSGNESDGSSSVSTMASTNSNFQIEPLDENLSMEESDKRLEKLRKQHAAFRQKVFRASLRLRAINVGQDRYRRTYWVLPLTGGVYAEGMESGAPDHYEKAQAVAASEATVKTEVQDDENEEKEGKSAVEDGTAIPDEKEKSEDQKEVKIENTSADNEAEKITVKLERNEEEENTLEKTNEAQEGKVQQSLENEVETSEDVSSNLNNLSGKQSADQDLPFESSPNKTSSDQKSEEIQKNSDVPRSCDVLLAEKAVAGQEISEAVNGDTASVLQNNAEAREKVSEHESKEEIDAGEERSLCADSVDDDVDEDSGVNRNGNALDDEEDMDYDNDDDFDNYSDTNDLVGEKTENGLDNIKEQTPKAKFSSESMKDASGTCVDSPAPHVNGDIFGHSLTTDSHDVRSPLCVTVSLSSPSSDKPDVTLTRQPSLTHKPPSEPMANGPSNVIKTPLESVSLSSESVNLPSMKIQESLTVAVSLADPSRHSPLLVKTHDPSRDTDRVGAKGVVIDLDALSSDPKQSNVGLIAVDKTARAINGWVSEDSQDKEPLLSPRSNYGKPNSLAMNSPTKNSLPNTVSVSPNSKEAEQRSSLASPTKTSDTVLSKPRPLINANFNSHSDTEKHPREPAVACETITPEVCKTGSIEGDERDQGQKSSTNMESLVVGKTEGSKSSPTSGPPTAKAGSDILKVPSVATSPRGVAGEVAAAETLVSILNYSIQQAYMEEDEKVSRSVENVELKVKENDTARTTEKQVTSDAMPESLPESNKDSLVESCNSLQKASPPTVSKSPIGAGDQTPTSSLLSSSLLFSAIPKLTESLNITTTTVTNTVRTDSSLKSVLAGSSSQPAPLSLQVTRTTTASTATPKAARSRGESSSFHGGSNMFGASSSSSSSPLKPIPAHTRPINPQPLPPFHPSAQANTALDLTPPAAHSANKHKSSLPLTLLPSLPLPMSHQAPTHSKNSYLPGLPHPYHFGPTSASETLLSLASIVSPPPAHQQQPHRFTPATTKTTSSSTPVPSPLSSSTPKSSLVSQKDVGESTYTSSELLQQAASHVRRTTEGKKFSPSLLSHMAASTSTNPGTTSVATASLSPLKPHGTSALPSSPRGAAASSKEDFLSAYTVPPSHSLSMSPASSSASLSPSRGGGGGHQTNGSSRPHTPVSATTPTPGAEIVDHNLWFSILPRAPCDDQSITMPVSQQQQFLNANSAAAAATSLLMTLSTSPSALTSLLNSPTASGGSPGTAAAGGCGSSPGSLDSLLPALQANPSLLTQEVILQLLQSPSQPGSGRQSPCSSQALDSSGDFKVPPPRDMTPLPDPWDLLRAAQGEAQPIPKNAQHGWWKIRDLAQLRGVMPAALERGIREKSLQRGIHRYLDYAKLHCVYDSGKGEVDPDAEPEPPAKKAKKVCGNKDEKVADNNGEQVKKDNPANSILPSGTNTENITSGRGEPMEDAESEDSNMSAPELRSSRRGKAKLEQTEGAEKTEFETKEENSTAGEIAKKEEDTGDMDENTKEEVVEEGEEAVAEDFVPPDAEGSWSIKVMHEIELSTLEEVEALEERIFQASLQAKQGWRPPKDDTLVLVDRSVTETKDNESYPLDVAISRLLELEANIERRYLKPPLIRSVMLNMSNLNSSNERHDGDFSDDEEIPPGLLLWRQAVVGSESPAQLSLCTQLLAKSISWEKSIMRVTCQICRKDDNEAELLLCDGCDKGYHTYCFRPQMQDIPEGDWYCFECVSKATGIAHCVVCGTKGGKMVSCSHCPRSIHIECLDPPLPRMPKRWQCSNCLADKGSKRSRKRKESLPTVQRITITKLVLKEEPPETEDIQMNTIMETAAAAAAMYSSPQPSPSSATPTSTPGGDSSRKSGGGARGGGSRSGGNSSAPKSSSPRKRDRKRKAKDPSNEDQEKSENGCAPPPQKKSTSASDRKCNNLSATATATEDSGERTEDPASEVAATSPRREPARKSRKDRKTSSVAPAPPPAAAAAVLSSPVPDAVVNAELSCDGGDEENAKEKEEEDSPALEERRVEKGNAKDFVVCGKILTELEKHEQGWPFLKPVNRKQFPSYKKYIKFPMDFSTSRGKLKNKDYRHRQEFAADMRLIFNNCETFNEDESEVGQCGFQLRAYFEKRWLELFPDDAL
ncbi:bromodomain adjacent to zinc finger domain protein 2B [Elysia marginata]|uniref:Bromodomain adjacent to zinc finger domain protein 2B n=1 Tax=Elysia marginata TaxID=1093978 RepID=A0AAV4HXM7_9GAST|nr:bromodomain adjacent to zinc finger domain protein 2B [Elysia marginata]